MITFKCSSVFKSVFVLLLFPTHKPINISATIHRKLQPHYFCTTSPLLHLPPLLICCCCFGVPLSLFTPSFSTCFFTTCIDSSQSSGPLIWKMSNSIQAVSSQPVGSTLKPGINIFRLSLAFTVYKRH